MTSTNPIAQALEPARLEAVARAEMETDFAIRRVLAKLADAGWDLDKVAPSPRNDYSRASYLAAKNYRGWVESLTERNQRAVEAWASANRCSSYSPSAPSYVHRSPERERRFIDMAGEGASASFDGYVAKLIAKVGEVASATYEGTLWWGSILTVTKLNGAVECWHTQQIINVSVLGKVFNQWPTRRMK